MAQDKYGWVKPAITIGLVGAGVWLGYNYIIAPLLETVNLKDTAEEKKTKEATEKAESGLTNLNYWDLNYYKQKPGNAAKVKLLPWPVVEQYAEDIYDSLNYWWFNDWPRIHGIFEDIGYKSQISQLADAFYKKYKLSLFTHMKRFSDKDVLTTLLKKTEGRKTGFETATGKEIN